MIESTFFAAGADYRPLIAAAEVGRADIAGRLIEADARPQLQTPDGS